MNIQGIETRRNTALIAGIVLGNLVPLYGAMFWDWSLFNIFYLYWVENILIGVFTLVRMLMVSVRQGGFGVFEGIFTCAFFTFHYGLFCMAHGMIMTCIFYDGVLEIDEKTLFILPFLNEINGFLWAFVGIVLVEFLFAFKAIASDRRDDKRAKEILFAPYGRIAILHVTILVGGFLSQSFDFATGALIVLIVLKTLYDVGIFRFGDQVVATVKNRE